MDTGESSLRERMTNVFTVSADYNKTVVIHRNDTKRKNSKASDFVLVSFSVFASYYTYISHIGIVNYHNSLGKGIKNKSSDDAQETMNYAVK